MLTLILLLSITSCLRVDLGVSLIAQQLQARADYIKFLDQQTECSFDKSFCNESGSPDKLRSLHVSMLARRDNRASINPPQFYMEPGEEDFIKLTVEYKKVLTTRRLRML